MNRRRFVSASVITSSFLLSNNLFGNSIIINPSFVMGEGFQNIWSSFKSIKSNELSGGLESYFKDMVQELKRKNIQIEDNLLYVYGDNHYFIPFRSPGILGLNREDGIVLLTKNKSGGLFEHMVMPRSMVRCLDSFISTVDHSIKDINIERNSSKLFMPQSIIEKIEDKGILTSLVYTNGYGDKFEIKRMRDFHVLSIKGYSNS